MSATAVRIYVGIDPGKQGAVVALDGQSRILGCWDQPLLSAGKTKSGKSNRTTYDEAGMVRILRECAKLAAGHGALVTLEDVHPMPREGAVGAFTFGVGCGLWRGMVAAMGMSYQLVSPQVWTRALLLGATGEDAKARSVLIASRLWPTLDLQHKKDHDRAQAALIAEYGRRAWMGGSVSATAVAA